MTEFRESFLFQLLAALDEYQRVDEEGFLDDALDALPKTMTQDLQHRVLRILGGDDPREVLELPWRAGGRPPKSMRDFCIAIEWCELRARNEKAEVAHRVLRERWKTNTTSIKNAVRRFGSDELKLLARLSPKIVNFSWYRSLTDKYHQMV